MAIAVVEVLPDPAGCRRALQRGERRGVDVHSHADGLDIALLPHPETDERPVTSRSEKRRKPRPFGFAENRPQHSVVNRHDPLDVTADFRVRDRGHHPVACMGDAEVKADGRIERGLAEGIFGHGQGIGVKTPFRQHLPQEKPGRDRTPAVGR